MTKIDLENLPYPMFVTTDEEKEQLRDALAIYPAKGTWLCEYVEEGLRSKIMKSLGDNAFLTTYILPQGYDCNDREERRKIRKIWIKKLLAYSPETN